MINKMFSQTIIRKTHAGTKKSVCFRELLYCTDYTKTGMRLPFPMPRIVWVIDCVRDL